MEWSKQSLAALLILIRPKPEDRETEVGVNRELSKLIINFILPLKSEAERTGDLSLEVHGRYRIDVAHMADLAILRYCDVITTQVAKEVIGFLWHEWSRRDPLQILLDMGVIGREDDLLDLGSIVASVMSDNPQAVFDFRNGKLNAIGRLIGETMKRLGKGADPKQIKMKLELQLGGQR